MNDIALIDVKNKEHLDQTIKNQAQEKLPILIDFWAPWCGPCRAMLPHVEKIKQKYGSNLIVLKVNIDDLPDLANEYGIRGIPTLILFPVNKDYVKEPGSKTEAQLDTFLKTHCPDLSSTS